MRTPDSIWSPLLRFYEENIKKEHLESWPRGNTYTNHWSSPTYMISFEDTSLRGDIDLFYVYLYTSHFIILK
jgi:hypothetical protein